MRAYVIRRVLLAIPTLFIVTLLVFLSVRFIPGDIIDVMAARMTFSGSGSIDEEALRKGCRSQIERFEGFGEVPGHV